MSKPIVRALRDFQSILGLCPCCQSVFRLSDAQVFYARRPVPSWYDELERDEETLDSARERFDDRRRQLRAQALDRAERRLPSLVRGCERTLSRLGFWPKDAKCLFDPVDFVVFRGMYREERVRTVVLLDGPADTPLRGRAQESIAGAVEEGRYEWRTVRVGRDGRIVVSRRA